MMILQTKGNSFSQSLQVRQCLSRIFSFRGKRTSSHQFNCTDEKPRKVSVTPTSNPDAAKAFCTSLKCVHVKKLCRDCLIVFVKSLLNTDVVK